MDILRVATWNVNSIRTRQDQVVQWLVDHSPDALCLQETKVGDNIFPVDAFLAVGYTPYFYGQKNYNGVAILTKSDGPVVGQVTRGFSDAEAEDPQARIIACELAGIRIINAYIPNGQSVDSDKFVYKLGWMKRMTAYLQRESTVYDHRIFCGDFNIAPQDRDVWQPEMWKDKVLCTPQERTSFQSWIQTGLMDAFRLHNEESDAFSWWDYRQMGFANNHGLRIDHMLVTDSLAKASSRCLIDIKTRGLDQPSDHAPVVLDLDLSCCDDIG